MIFKELVNDIDKDEDEFMKFMSTNKDFSNKILRTLKSNYKDTVSRKKNTFLSSVITTIQEITNQQTVYNDLIARLNIITFGPTASNTGTDGLQPKGKDPIVYYTTGTDTLNGIITDGGIVRTNLNQFLAKLSDRTTFKIQGDAKDYIDYFIIPETTKIDETFLPIGTNSEFNIKNFKREYALLSQDVTDLKKYETFKNELIGNILSNASLLERSGQNIEKEFDAYWIGKAKPAFDKQNKAATDFLNYMETNVLKDYINFVAVDRTKKREMAYSDIPGNTQQDAVKADRQKYINSLILPSTNTNTKTFNDLSAPILITKTKFN